MIRSMTGFGRAERSAAGWRCAAELRSVNGRYLEVRLRLPGGLANLDEPLKRHIKARCERGKIDGSLTLLPESEGESQLRLNRPLLRGLAHLIGEVRTVLGQPLRVSLGDLLQVRDLVLFDSWEEQDEEVEALATATLDAALDGLVTMRETEGAALQAELESRAAVLLGLIERAAPLAAQLPDQYARRLREHLAQLSEGPLPGEDRLLQEIALAADRLDVAEELTRFRTHLQHLHQILAQGGAVGRKFEFLLQELFREATTLGTKCNDVEVSAIAIEMKAEIEKLREQIQNIE
jgi:uncharacterized protein (TIGR00255 family)